MNLAVIEGSPAGLLGNGFFPLTRLFKEPAIPIMDLPHEGLLEQVVKTLRNPVDRQEIEARISTLSAADVARWGSMSVHQTVCHLRDAYRVALGERTASPATGVIQRTLIKWLALQVPLKWPKGFPAPPELEQGKSGSAPLEFELDRISLQSTLTRFCDHLPHPQLPHPIFGQMTAEDWWRWGYLHADHHLRQFGR
jgi:hypothetical protein